MTVNHTEIRYFEFVFLIGIYFLRSFPCLVLILYLSAEFERLCVHVLLISLPPESGLLLAQTVTASNVVRSEKEDDSGQKPHIHGISLNHKKAFS